MFVTHFPPRLKKNGYLLISFQTPKKRGSSKLLTDFTVGHLPNRKTCDLIKGSVEKNVINNKTQGAKLPFNFIISNLSYELLNKKRLTPGPNPADNQTLNEILFAYNFCFKEN